MKISIIDTGCSNILSLKRAVELFNNNVIITEDPKTILSSNKIFFPGVGAFRQVMKSLEAKKIFETLKMAEEKNSIIDYMAKPLSIEMINELVSNYLN